MSGTNLAPWSQPAHEGVARKRAIKLARQFECYTPNNWAQTIECLRNVSATRITAAFYDFFVITNLINKNFAISNNLCVNSPGIRH